MAGTQSALPAVLPIWPAPAAHLPLHQCSSKAYTSKIREGRSLDNKLEHTNSLTCNLPADLAQLQSLEVAGNPIMLASFARLRALACLPQRLQGLNLDGSPASTEEAGVLAACGGERLPQGFAIIAEYAPPAA